MMKTEIESAANYLTYLVKAQAQHSFVPSSVFENFNTELKNILHERYKMVWDESQPERGEFHRSIRVRPSTMDPSLVKAAKKSRISLGFLEAALEEPFTMLVSPGLVKASKPDGKNGMQSIYLSHVDGNRAWTEERERERKAKKSPGVLQEILSLLL